MPTHVIDYQIPLRMLSQFHLIPFALNLCHKVFCCVCYAHVHSHQRNKLDPRALNCIFLRYFNSQKGYKCFHSPVDKYYVSMDIQFCKGKSYSSGNVSLVPLQGEIRSEKRVRILGQEEDSNDLGKGKSLDAPNPMTLEFESEERKDEKPARLFQQCYTRRNKYATVIPSLGFNTLNDATMPLDDTSETNPEVHVPSPLTLEIAILNPQVGDQGRRYPLRDRKEYDKLGFSKLSSNVVYPIYDFISHHCPSKTRLVFALQLSFVFITSHFQEALEDFEWKFAMVEEMKFLKNFTWEMVKLLKEKKTMECKVFQIKYKLDGIIDWYKARLVVKGYK